MTNSRRHAVSVGCDVPAGGDIKCNRAGITRVIVTLGDLDDSLNFLLPAEFPIAITVDGGTGGDVLRGSSQADVVSGGEGGDSITQTGGADDVSGGPGFDGISFALLNTVTVSPRRPAQRRTGGRRAEGQRALGRRGHLRVRTATTC